MKTIDALNILSINEKEISLEMVKKPIGRPEGLPSRREPCRNGHDVSDERSICVGGVGFVVFFKVVLNKKFR